MEQWIPLFNLFLSSPSPDSSAINYLLNSQSPPLTSSFLSLLLSPVPNKPSLKFLQTLPPLLQSLILSCLSRYHLNFDPLLLNSLATHIVNSDNSNFWVKCAAHNLLDEMIDEFGLPEWLRKDSMAKLGEPPMLTWLPFDKCSLPKKQAKPFHLPVKEQKIKSFTSSPVPVLSSNSLNDHEIEMAMSLKRVIGTVESVSETIALANKIQQFCLKTQNLVESLSLIELWKINDDMAKILLSNFSTDLSKNMNFSSLILSSIILPKLLVLQQQPSSVIISTTLEFCKKHPVSAVDSLLFPLIFQKGGLNIILCDLISKIIKDCLHPLQVSYFIQSLLSNNNRERKLVCLPKHLEYISNELIWNESLFQLFYNMMNKDKDVFLIPDSIEKLVLVMQEMVPKFCKSLKFGNFMLCFVTKFGDKLKFYKALLENSAEKTDTFVTKAILAKLRAI